MGPSKKVWIRTAVITAVLLAVGTAAVLIFKPGIKSSDQAGAARTINPAAGDIKLTITSTGTVQPNNRVEIKPTTDGRVEDILVQEGNFVKKGQVVAWMSSMERASLLDAARSKGADELKYWEDVYKPTPLLAPIDGEVIVRAIEPGQTVTGATAVLVLSDRLIVVANVDETDIGKVKTGQTALVGLDAYPDVKARGKVNHISYESKMVNNVTTYEVDILIDNLPSVFRSGMTANVTIIQKLKKNILLLPMEAVKIDDSGSFVYIYTGEKTKPEKRKIQTGENDLANVEITGGVGADDKVMLDTKKFVLQQRTDTVNPFMPGRRPTGTSSSSNRPQGQGQGRPQ